MKTTPHSEQRHDKPLPDDLVEELMADDMAPEYDIDYSRACPKRFAARLGDTRTVELEADVAAVFTTQAAVNAVLRASSKRYRTYRGRRSGQLS